MSPVSGADSIVIEDFSEIPIVVCWSSVDFRVSSDVWFRCWEIFGCRNCRVYGSERWNCMALIANENCFPKMF